MSAKRPTAVTVATRTSRYDSPTQVTAPTETPKVRCSVGSATVTMDASSWPMKAPTHTAATANQWASGCSRMTWGRRGSTSSRSHVHVHGRAGRGRLARSSPASVTPPAPPQVTTALARMSRDDAPTSTS